MNKCALNARLLCAAELTRQNATFADIGTDHAYLPLFLLETGKISHAYCCDINEGPLNSARRNAKEQGRDVQMSFILTDGAAVLSGKGITDYAICGMGGELIADIIDRAPHLCDGGINLILQPMTKQEKLREYLACSGFEIKAESYSFDAEKYYVCILASYSGKSRKISPLEAVVGSPMSKYYGGEYRKKYLENKLKAYENAYSGKISAGIACGDDLELIKELEKYINSLSPERK